MERQTQELADNYNDAESELRYALDNDETEHELENLYYALHNTAVQANRAVPPDLEQRYRERLDGLERKAVMKRRVILTAVLGSCVLFAGLIGTGIWYKLRTNEIAKVLITLQNIEEEKRFEDIEKTIAKIETDKPDIAKTAEVAPVIAKLQSMLEEDGKRAKDFERYAVQAEAALSQKPAFHELKPVAETLEQAAKFIRTDSEKERLANLQSQYKLQTAQRQREIDTTFGKELGMLNEKFNTVPRSQRDKAAQDILASIDRQVKELLDKSPDASVPQRKEGDDLRTSIAQRQERIRDAVAEDTAFQDLFKLRTLPEYKTEFSKFLEKYPNHLAAYDIKTVADDLDTVRDVFSAIQNLCNEYSDCNGDYSKLQLAAASIQEHCTELADKINGQVNMLFPPAADIARLNGTQPFSKETFDETEKVLLLLVRKDLYPLITEDNKWYYCTAPLAIGEKKPLYVTTFASAGKELPKQPAGKDYARSDEMKKKKRQRDWAVETSNAIDTIKEGAVSKADKICTVMNEMVPLDGLDPILKVVMMNLFIENYAKTDPMFAEVFEDFRGKIKKSGIDMETNWMDVESATTVPERQKSDALLTRLPNFKQLSDEVMKKTTEFRDELKGFSPEFQLLGILHKESSGWVCKPVPPNVRDGGLFILNVSGSKTTPSVIGTVSGGKVTIAEGGSLLRQCLPVFWKH
jgi:hypothetical protein